MALSLESQLDTARCRVEVGSHERSRHRIEDLGAVCLEVTVADWGVRESPSEKWEGREEQEEGRDE